MRELRNVIERACVLSKGESLNLEDGFAEGGGGGVGIRTDLPFKEAKGQLVDQFEREYIVDLMRRHKLNLSAASFQSLALQIEHDESGPRSVRHAELDRADARDRYKI